MAKFDRAGLEHLVERYLDAVTGHAATRLPLAGTVRYTENGVELGLDDGLWGTAAKAGKYRIIIPDVASQQVGYMGVIEEAGQLICVTTRLRAEDGVITEIETLAAHPSFTSGGGFGAGAKALEDMGKPHAEFTTKLKPDEKVSRQKLIEIANSYFSGLELNTGRYPVPFDPECQRRENGIQTTSNPNFGFGSNQPRESRCRAEHGRDDTQGAVRFRRACLRHGNPQSPFSRGRRRDRQCARVRLFRS